MSSNKCQSCGLVNFAGAAKCMRCKQPLAVVSPATKSKTSLNAKEQSSRVHNPEKGSNESSSNSKTLRQTLPLVIFGVPLVLVLKDRMFDPPVKAGGYTDTLQLSVLVGCIIGLIVTAIIIVSSRKK